MKLEKILSGILLGTVIGMQPMVNHYVAPQQKSILQKDESDCGCYETPKVQKPNEDLDDRGDDIPDQHYI